MCAVNQKLWALACVFCLLSGCGLAKPVTVEIIGVAEQLEDGSPFDVVDALPATELSQDRNVQRGTPGRDYWPMFRGNSQLTGVSASSLPEKLSLLWTYEAGGKNEAFESSAAIVDGVAYVGSMGGFLHAVGLPDGKLKWKYSTNEAAIKSSPAVDQGRVFFGDENGLFHVLDAGSGKLLWKFETGGEIASSANVLADRVLFGSYDESLYCLAVADGKLLWQFKTQGYVHCTPAIIEGKTFISGCDSQLRVIDVLTGQEMGSCEMESQTGASPAVVGDWLYVGHFGNQVLGIEWKKPEIIWKYEHPDRQFPFYSSPAATEDLVIIGGRDKMVHALDPRTGKARWTFPAKAKIDSSPVLVGNRVFVGSNDSNVYSLDVATGREVWRFTTGGPVTASPAVAENRLVIGSEDGKLYCFGEQR